MPNELLGQEGNTQMSVIMFSDIKDFTLKTSLLTSKQIDEVLSEHEKIVVPCVQQFQGSIIKTMGDAYMVVFSDALNALHCCIEIQKKACEYNKNKKLNLHKIEFRISLNYGEVIRKLTISGEDYFGEAVNMSHRLESITPENKIFLTKEVYELAKNEKDVFCYPLGKTTFKGILREVEIYELLYREQDIISYQQNKLKRENLNTGYTSEYANKVKEADEVIFTCASVGALIGLQPIPLLDTFSLIPLHAYMLIRIASIYGQTLSVDDALDFTKKMMAGIGITYLAMQGAIGASKVLLPVVAGYITIPLNFSLTFSLGKIFSSYYYHHIYGVAFSNTDMRELFTDKRLGGKEMGKKKKDEIIAKGKEAKDKILGSDIIQNIKNTLQKK